MHEESKIEKIRITDNKLYGFNGTGFLVRGSQCDYFYSENDEDSKYQRVKKSF